MKKLDIADYIGATYNRLTVLSYSHKDQRPYWNFRCECGTEKPIRASHVLNGITKSCGCIRNGKPLLPKGTAARNSLLSAYKRNARERGYSWNLTVLEFKAITQEDCFYCGAPPSNINKTASDEYVYSGIDRVNNKESYHSDNVVACCKICNFAKRDMNKDAFIEWARRVVNHSG